MMKKLLLLLALAMPLRAQTPLPLAVQTWKLAPVGAGAYASPMAVYNAPSPQPTTTGNTLVAIVPTTDKPMVSETGNTWTQNPTCPEVWTATALGAIETITVTYSSPQYTVDIFAEYPGQLTVDSCAAVVSGSGTAPLSASITTTAAGDLILGYGWNTTTNYDVVTPATGFSLEGQQNIFLEDEIQSAAGSVSSSATITGTATVNWYQGIAALRTALQPVTLTFGPGTTVNGDVCMDMISYDDGSSLYGQNPAPQSVMQMENGAWVNIGTPVVQPNGLVAGSVTINPNYTVNGFIELELLVQTVIGVPPTAALPITPAQLANGPTGVCTSIIVYKNGPAPGILKYAAFGFTP
jgi:hypothetical protein